MKVLRGGTILLLAHALTAMCVLTQEVTLTETLSASQTKRIIASKEDSVKLAPGFHARAGSEFSARISTNDKPGLVIDHSTTLNLPSGRIENLNVYTADVDIAAVDFFVPDSANTLPRNSQTTCTAQGYKDKPDAFYNLAEWQELHPTRLKMNANFFGVVRGETNVRTDSCINLLGLSISGGKVVSPKDELVQGILADSLITFFIPGERQAARIVGSAEIVNEGRIGYFFKQIRIDNAISGIRLLKSGAVQTINGFRATEEVARSALGITSDGKTLKMAVIQKGTLDQAVNNRGITIAQLGEYMASIGVDDALMLDGSGSAAFLYCEDGICKDGIKPTLQSPSSDPQGYRSAPVFLGVK